MSWTDQLKANPLPWLLEEADPGPRYLALRDLLDRPLDDPELVSARRAAHQHGPIQDILAAIETAGYWCRSGPGYNPKYKSTVWSITTLAQLGASVKADERIAKACAYALDHSLTPGGQFTSNGAPSGTIDCLQGNLAWALTELGCDDPRLAKAYDWLARTVTGEGIAPKEDKSAQMRFYAYKSGPNFACGVNGNLPCAWGATKVMLAFSRWPANRRTELINRAIGQGIDFLFSVDPATALYPVGSGGKPNTSWFKFGFPLFCITDFLQTVEALVNLGYRSDPRLAHALESIRGKQDSRGLWVLEHDYTGKMWVDFGEKHKPNKWVTLRALRVLKKAA